MYCRKACPEHAIDEQAPVKYCRECEFVCPAGKNNGDVKD